MIRTQIYLTQAEKKALKSISIQLGKSQSILIREAVDCLIAKFSKGRRESIIDNVAGMWKDRDNDYNIDKIRKEWDRKFNL
jgi:hypothetical protein